MFKNKSLCHMITGAIVGAGLGILFAPLSGKETREKLMKKKDELMDKMKDMDLDEAKDKFLAKIEDIENDLMDLDAEEVFDMAKKKVRKIKKKVNMLLEEAMDSGDDSFTEAANEMKERAIEITKSVLEKLEEA